MRKSIWIALAALLLAPITALTGLTPEARIIPELQPQAVQVIRATSAVCSGVWITDSHVMTAKHCVTPDYTEQYAVKDFAGQEAEASLVLVGEGNGINHDWAVLRVKDHRSPVWAKVNCGPVQYGQRVIGIGNALGQTGLLVYLGRVHEPSYDITKLSGMPSSYWKHGILSNMHGGPGVSGGPMWNLDGELVGLMVGALAPRNVGLIQQLSFPTQYISLLCGEHGDK